MALGYTGLAAELLEMVKKQTLLYEEYLQSQKGKSPEVALRLARTELKHWAPSLAFTLNALMLGNYSTQLPIKQRKPFKAIRRGCYGNAFVYSLRDKEAAPVVGGYTNLRPYAKDLERYDPENDGEWLPLRGLHAFYHPLFTAHAFNVLQSGDVIDTTLPYSAADFSYFVWQPVPASILASVDRKDDQPGFDELNDYLFAYKKSLASHWPHILKYVTTA